MTPILSTALAGLFVASSWSGLASAAAIDQVPDVQLPITHQVAMTAYNAVPEQTDGDPHITASGAFSNPDIVAARSLDLADELPFGTVISIIRTGTTSPKCGIGMVKEMVGLRVIADSMHPRKRNQIDILFGTDKTVRVGGKRTNAANALGICKGIEIQVVGHVDVNNMPRNQAELKAAVEEAPLAVYMSK